MHSRAHSLALGVAVALLLACGTPGASSRDYTPRTPEDRRHFAEARRDIFPNDVRANPEAYAKQKVAWAGVVAETKLVSLKGQSTLLVVIDHHYFDWIEDHGAQREVFFLSPRGEGKLVILLAAKRDSMTQGEIDAAIPVGSMAVVIGTPKKPVDDAPGAPLIFLYDSFQFIDRQWYRTDMFDYGRPGEPLKGGPGLRARPDR